MRGEVLHRERHVARLARDAGRLGLGRVDDDACRRLLLALAREHFAEREGVVRVEARGGDGGGAELVGTVRELGPEPLRWCAVVAALRHPGPSPWSAAKSNARACHDAALAEAHAAGADESLLLDATGFLVEGARTNLVVVVAEGAARTPPLARGAQAGLARALALARVPGLREADVAAAELAGAREVVAMNAVRGARPIVRIDGAPVGAGEPGPWAERLARALREE